MKEIWKNIKDYEGYQVSNLGRIRTYNKITYTKHHGKRKWKNRILKPRIGKDKCSRIELWKNGKHKSLLLYRLIADTFLEQNLNTNLTINHKDGNRLNNRVDNLEWTTIEDNIKYGFKNGQFDSICKKCKLIKDNKIYYFNSYAEASRFLLRNHGYISLQIKKQNKYAYSKNKEKYLIKPF